MATSFMISKLTTLSKGVEILNKIWIGKVVLSEMTTEEYQEKAMKLNAMTIQEIEDLIRAEFI